MTFFRAGQYCLEASKKTCVWGILNVTPDSFSDGGLYLDAELAVPRAAELLALGADVIDIGAQSTRPGHTPVPPGEELHRLEPVLTALNGALTIPVSVDTFSPETALFSLQHGASIINDVSGTVNPLIAEYVKKYNAGLVIVHNPGGSDFVSHFDGGVVSAVSRFFEESLRLAGEAGLSRDHICLDPGFGFGKSREDDITLLRELGRVDKHGCSMLVGVSRKRLVGAICGGAACSGDAGTVAVQTAAVIGGADMLRSHDVPAALCSARVADSVRGIRF